MKLNKDTNLYGLMSRAQVHFKIFMIHTHTHLIFLVIIQHLGAIHNNLK